MENIFSILFFKFAGGVSFPTGKQENLMNEQTSFMKRFLMAIAILLASATLTGVHGTPSSSKGEQVRRHKVSSEMAARVAGNYFNTNRKQEQKAAGQEGRRFRTVSVGVENRDTLFYILNDTLSGTFAIVAADMGSRPVLGYSRGGLFDPGQVPPAMKQWLESRKREIYRLRQGTAASPVPHTTEWEALLETEDLPSRTSDEGAAGREAIVSEAIDSEAADSNAEPDSSLSGLWSPQSRNDMTAMANSQSAATLFPAVGPLVQTTWDQKCYYNTLCPTDASGPCGHAVTGCVATAMAQIMKYWNYPATGTGSNSYTHPTYGTLSANFGSTIYRWNEMPAHLTEENGAVATLMYHCGVAVNMYYSAWSSAAILSPDALITYFGYSPSGRYEFREDYSDTEWTALMKAELNSLRPVLYRGSGEQGGHAFIVDGFEGEDFFHINWGWGGGYDGYFYLGTIEFSQDQGAVTGIYPAGLPGGTPGIHLSTTALTLGGAAHSGTVILAATVNWSATTDQPWLTVSPASGSAGLTQMVVSASDNNTGALRTGTVTIAATGYGYQTVTVTQHKKTNVTAGNLKSLLGAELGTATHLTLTGTIDARDFRTMRDEMPQLQSVDLRGVTIVAYTGTEGTAGYYAEYPANTLPTNAFSNLYNLSAVELPPSLVAIGTYVFRNCQGMGTLYIPASVTSIGWYAFIASTTMLDVDPANPAYSSLEGLLYNKSVSLLIFCPQSKTGTLTLPGTVTSIEVAALSYCYQLDTLHIPASVTFIGEDALFYNSAYIVVDSANGHFSSLDGVLYDKTLYRLIHCPIGKNGVLAIPEGVHIIMPWAFSFCYNLTEITLPSSASDIGEYAFYQCSALEAIHARSPLPADLSTRDAVFDGVETASCILYVPVGALTAYQSAVQWQDFQNILEEEITEEACDLTTTLTATPNIINGVTNFSLVVKVAEIGGADSQGEITVVIPRDGRWIFYWAPGMTSTGGEPVDNAVWTYEGTDPHNHIFRTAAVVNGHSHRTFGLEAVFDPGATRGVSTITTQIITASGGDTVDTNNSDSEKINYFGI